MSTHPSPSSAHRAPLDRFGVWALAAGLAWLALGLESIVRPEAQDYRDALFLVPWLLTLVALTDLHRGQRAAGDRVERMGFGIVAGAMVGAALGTVPVLLGGWDQHVVIAVPVWVVGMVVLGIGTRRAGIAPRRVGLLVALSEPATILAGLALSPWVPLQDRGSFSGAVAHGICFLLMAAAVRRTGDRVPPRKGESDRQYGWGGAVSRSSGS